MFSEQSVLETVVRQLRIIYSSQRESGGLSSRDEGDSRPKTERRELESDIDDKKFSRKSFNILNYKTLVEICEKKKN